MPSLDRAYGLRGAAIALGMACVAGGVQGVLAWQFDHLAVKIVVGLSGTLVLIMAGAISARQSLTSALGLGLMMGAGFFLARWIGWALMDGGFGAALDFLATGPPGWPAWLDARGISGFWKFEAVSMFVPALLGCYFGQERAETA